MLFIKNARILTMAEADYDSGFVGCRDGKIVQLGDMAQMLETDHSDVVIDAKGMVLMPGLVDSHCHIGMTEDSVGFEGDDANEMTDPPIESYRRDLSRR